LDPPLRNRPRERRTCHLVGARGPRADDRGVNDRSSDSQDVERCGAPAAAYAGALRAGDSSAAAGVLVEALHAGLAGVRLLDRIVAPALHEIGRLWERGEITVADEHLATAITHRGLALVYPELLSALPGSQPRVLLAGVQGERHALGLRIVADVLEGAGHDVLYLGADVPRAALLDAVLRHAPAAVGLAATLSASAEPLAEAIDDLHGLDTGALLLIGGQGVPSVLRSDPRAVYAGSAEAALSVLAGARPRTPARRGPISIPDARPAPAPAEGGSLLERSVDAAAGAADEARRMAQTAYRYRDLAFRDPMTGLWNRRALDDRLAALADAGQPVPPTVMVDIDHFKRVNDLHGHEAGDRVLAAVAEAISDNVRECDFAARYGGDEFAVLLHGASQEVARHVAERVRTAVAGSLELPVTVSIGIAEQTGDRRLTLLAADRALYEAKRAGRNRVA
jgi:diguanylate cyclase (GGDEF)-like protein